MITSHLCHARTTQHVRIYSTTSSVMIISHHDHDYLIVHRMLAWSCMCMLAYARGVILYVYYMLCAWWWHNRKMWHTDRIHVLSWAWVDHHTEARKRGGSRPYERCYCHVCTCISFLYIIRTHSHVHHMSCMHACTNTCTHTHRGYSSVSILFRHKSNHVRIVHTHTHTHTHVHTYISWSYLTIMITSYLTNVMIISHHDHDHIVSHHVMIISHHDHDHIPGIHMDLLFVYACDVMWLNIFCTCWWCGVAFPTWQNPDHARRLRAQGSFHVFPSCCSHEWFTRSNPRGHARDPAHTTRYVCTSIVFIYITRTHNIMYYMLSLYACHACTNRYSYTQTLLISTEITPSQSKPCTDRTYHICHVQITSRSCCISYHTSWSWNDINACHIFII
jgi:hypothetical protein